MKKITNLIVIVALLLSLTACSFIPNSDDTVICGGVIDNTSYIEYNEVKIPSYTSHNQAYIEINNNEPFFTENDYTTEVFETYSELDNLGRCGVTYANICKELMPTEERGEIGQVKPAGWHTVKYDCVDGKYLYNRCHLIGFQLAGENANEKNLITGTRYLNIEGMLDAENKVAKYVKETGNHVLYRVTPVYNGNNLLAYGVVMEGYSVEDNGAGIKFCLFAYNVQPGIEINYLNGESKLIGEEYVTQEETSKYTENLDGIIYILNIESKKYHIDTCRYANSMSEENKETFNGTKDWLKDNGYEPCGVCKP